MHLSDVSKTAIATLRSRAIESEGHKALIHDPVAVDLLARLEAVASPEERALLFERPFSRSLTVHLALRARKYDALTNEFIKRHPSSLVVNLGCGFDTRFWRIDHAKCEYVEIDLPEIIEVKRGLLEGRLGYHMIGASVLDHSWIDAVNPRGDRASMLIAEGLFMYLPKAQVIELFRAISERFRDSCMIFEVVTEKYTRGIWKRIVIRKLKRQLGYDAGSSYSFGVRNAREVESYGEGLRVTGEWFYAQDPDARPRILKYLGMSRTQWTVIMGVNT